MRKGTLLLILALQMLAVGAQGQSCRVYRYEEGLSFIVHNQFSVLVGRTMTNTRHAIGMGIGFSPDAVVYKSQIGVSPLVYGSYSLPLGDRLKVGILVDALISFGGKEIQGTPAPLKGVYVGVGPLVSVAVSEGFLINLSANSQLGLGVGFTYTRP